MLILLINYCYNIIFFTKIDLIRIFNKYSSCEIENQFTEGNTVA